MSYFLKASIDSKLIVSPFREDNNPTCGFYYSKSNILYFHDFATDEHLDCIEVIKKLFNLSYGKAIQLAWIEQDKFETTKISKPKSKKLEWIPHQGDFSYFHKLGISDKTLNKFNVKAAKAVYIDEDLYWRSTEKNPIFVYQFPSGKVKLYRPLSKDRDKKWKSNCSLTDVQGYVNLPEKGRIVIITSSMKDLMVLHEMKYNAIAFNSESIPTRGESGDFIAKTIDNLKKRFDRVILFLDNDTAGKEYSEKISKKYNIEFILLPDKMPKDVSDMVQKYGFRRSKKLVNKLIAKPYLEAYKFEKFVNESIK